MTYALNFCKIGGEIRNFSGEMCDFCGESKVEMTFNAYSCGEITKIQRFKKNSERCMILFGGNFFERLLKNVY